MAPESFCVERGSSAVAKLIKESNPRQAKTAVRNPTRRVFIFESPHPCIRAAMASRRRKHESDLSEAGVGQGAPEPPLPHTPIPAKERKTIAHVNKFRHHEKASVAVLRLYSPR
jgi:hypothetical protein